jgi:tetratricopeptide (TPR) repeat protein
VPPRRLRPDAPRDLETICLKCLEKSPGKRYATALDLADDLGRFQQGEPILAKRIGALRRSWKWARRHPWQSISAALVAFAVATFIGLTYRHNLQLRAEIGRTEAKAAEARRNYQEATLTIQEMLARLQDRRFAGTPRLKELGRDQMEDALSFYNRILRQNDANDPAVRADTARAFGVISTNQYQLGRTDQAEQQVRQALELIERLRSEKPDDLDYLKLQVECLVRLSVYLDALGRPDQAIAASQESIPLAERLARASPDNLSHQEMVAFSHDACASRLRGLKRLSDARDHYRIAIEIRERLVRDRPDPAKLPALIQRHADTLMHDGLTLWNMQQNPQAEARFREAEKLVLAIPAEQRNDVSLGALYACWSGMLQTSGRFDEAIDRTNAGLSRVEPYLQVEPNDAIARDAALQLHGNRAVALSSLGNHGEAAAEWTRVIDLSGQPAPARYRLGLALELLHAGELARALAEARQLKSTEGVSGGDCYNLGCLYSLAAAAVRHDKGVPSEQRARLTQSHIADALRWLRSAAEAGYFRDAANRDHARKDSDLEIVRDRAEFRQIIESNGAKS